MEFCSFLQNPVKIQKILDGETQCSNTLSHSLVYYTTYQVRAQNVRKPGVK